MTITKLEQVLESRLSWPDHKPRAAQRTGSPFKAEVESQRRLIEQEMARWGVRSFLISRNNQRIFAGDPGVALWWNQPPKREGQPVELRVIACDHYKTMAENMRAIYLTLDALRAIERWGAYSTAEATEGAKVQALPPPNGPPWWEVLGVGEHWPLDAVEMAYRTRAASAHPDRGGTVEQMSKLNAAIAEARKALGP